MISQVLALVIVMGCATPYQLTEKDCWGIGEALRVSYNKLNPLQIQSSRFHYEAIPVDLYPYFAMKEAIPIPIRQKVYCVGGVSYYAWRDSGGVHLIVAGKSYYQSDPKALPMQVTYRLFFYIQTPGGWWSEEMGPASVVFDLVGPGRYAPR